MMERETIPVDYKGRLDEVMSTAWRIFISQFISYRHEITTEAPFQHHFANIIEQVGNLYCLKRDDIFNVDLERQYNNIKGRKKYVDITCEFEGKIRCNVELKFKTIIQGATDFGQIDIYQDIEALELVGSDKSIGRFYAITDSSQYMSQAPRSQVRKLFATHNGHITVADKILMSNSKGRDNITVCLKNSYTFNWEKIDKWHFLELSIG